MGKIIASALRRRVPPLAVVPASASARSTLGRGDGRVSTMLPVVSMARKARTGFLSTFLDQ